jgi:hypothetical protein
VIVRAKPRDKRPSKLEMKNRSEIDPTRLLKRLTSRFEKTPTGEMQELVQLLCDQRAISYKQCKKLPELARACIARIADLANRLEATAAGLLGKASKSCTADPGGRRRVPLTT